MRLAVHSEPVSGRQYECLLGTVHTTSSAGGFDFHGFTFAPGVPHERQTAPPAGPGANVRPWIWTREPPVSPSRHRRAVRARRTSPRPVPLKRPSAGFPAQFIRILKKIREKRIKSRKRACFFQKRWYIIFPLRFKMEPEASFRARQ